VYRIGSTARAIRIGSAGLIAAIALLLMFFGCDNNDVTGPTNNPPGKPSNPSPANGATDQTLLLKLGWQVVDPDNDVLNYNLYFGTTPTPGLLDSNLTEIVCPIYRYFHGPLAFHTTYYWKVVAEDSHGESTAGDVWSFTTSNVFELANYDTDHAVKVRVGQSGLVYVADDNIGLHVVAFVDSFEVRDGVDTLDALIPVRRDLYSIPRFVFDVDVDSAEVYAYVSSRGDGVVPGGLDIIDVTDPDNIVGVGAYLSLSYVYAVKVIDDYVYAVDGNRLLVIDVSNRTAPVLAGQLVTGGFAHGVDASGNHAYVADGPGGLKIMNVSDPANPSLSGTYDTPDSAWSVFLAGNLAYVADGNSGLVIIDVTNPASPSLIGAYDTPGFAKDVYVDSGYAYVADFWNGGLHIVDVSTPAAPMPVASFDSQGGAEGVTHASGYVFLADTWRGISVFQFEP